MSELPRGPGVQPGTGLRQQRAAQLRAEMEARQREMQGAAAPAQAAAQPSATDQQPGGAPAAQESTQPAAFESTYPVGTGDYVVRDGDCIASIAKATGHFWETIWNEPANEELREARRDPNVLYPGDRVTIPRREQKQESGATEMRHRFVRRGQPCRLLLHLTDNGRAIANEPFTIDVEDQELSGTTDADGRLEVFVPAQATSAVLHIRERDYQLNIGYLNPLEAVSGIRARLNNLGYSAGNGGEEMDDLLAAALRQFQADYDLEVTGEPDQATRDCREEEHER